MRFLRDNGLSLVLVLLFLTFLVAQTLTGLREYNQEQRDHGQATVALPAYLATGHFMEATAENWESEFLQMAAYVCLTAFLFQKGSSKSKKIGERETVDRDPPGGARLYNETQLQHGGEALTLGQYLATSQFWFESFQNWQSEFLAIAAMVVLSIFLRHRGSPESKPVDAPHSHTGTD